MDPGEVRLGSVEVVLWGINQCGEKRPDTFSPIKQASLPPFVLNRADNQPLAQLLEFAHRPSPKEVIEETPGIWGILLLK